MIVALLKLMQSYRIANPCSRCVRLCGDAEVQKLLERPSIPLIYLCISLSLLLSLSLSLSMAFYIYLSLSLYIYIYICIYIICLLLVTSSRSGVQTEAVWTRSCRRMPSASATPLTGHFKRHRPLQHYPTPPPQSD